MKKEIQQIKIAEATGWKLADVQFPGNVWYRHAEKKEVCERQDLPDYITDLNAMHEAEKVMTSLQQCQFAEKLFRVLVGQDGVSEFEKIHATAAQRAEAFLRTLNLWEDDESEIDPRGHEERSMM